MAGRWMENNPAVQSSTGYPAVQKLAPVYHQ
jgi:hypothetical protein